MITPFSQTSEELQALLAVARGDRPGDLLVRGGKLVNVLSGEIYEAEVVTWRGRIAAVSREPGLYSATESIDLDGEYIAPGFIDAHVHIESSLCVPAEFANAVLPCGTTSVISDPHEIANVHGLEGIRFMLQASENLPLRVFIMLSSCVPATDMETSGARLSARDLATLLGERRVLGIAEVMNYPDVVAGASDMVDKVMLGHAAGVPVDGHAPLVRSQALQAYASAGITSDHESVGAEEALEKLRAGLHILIREGSTAKNLGALASIVNERTARHCSFATDDKQPDDLAREGHIDHSVRRAVQLGIDPVIALSMASINTARHYGLRDLGAIAPGYHADFITFSDLDDIRPDLAFAGGTLVAQKGKILTRCANPTPHPRNSVTTPRLQPSDFAIPCEGSRVRVIGALPDQIVTTAEEASVTERDGQAMADPSRDLLKIAVVERHKGTGNIGLGFVSGIKLRSGALASSVAHDSHNIVVVGCSDEDIALAARAIAEMGGGICAVENGQLLASLALPVAGLMSPDPWESVRERMEALLGAAQHLGSPLSNPYMAMAFLALPVIPALKLTDMGLCDVVSFSLVPLFISDSTAG